VLLLLLLLLSLLLLTLLLHRLLCLPGAHCHRRHRLLRVGAAHLGCNTWSGIIWR
jgi:hypothetical protein